jgi:putative tryptophan/tyrosine transport system ATP-binding protein
VSAVADTALEARGLRHTFNRGGANEVRALQGVELVVEPGAFVVLVGTNGSGKSTLLAAIAGDVVPDEGTVRLGDVDVTRWSAHVRARLIGRVAQAPAAGTAPHLTVAENLALAGQRAAPRRTLRRAVSRETRRDLAERVATLGMGLEERLDTPMGVLSGGQRQALTLLMATLVRPALLLLDEHTAALDPRSAEHVLRLTEDVVRRERLTTLMVTHSMQQAVRFGDRAVMLHNGRIVQDFAGARKRRLRVRDLLDCFEEVRNADLLDESAAEMLARAYV